MAFRQSPRNHSSDGKKSRQPEEGHLVAELPLFQKIGDRISTASDTNCRPLTIGPFGARR